MCVAYHIQLGSNMLQNFIELRNGSFRGDEILQDVLCLVDTLNILVDYNWGSATVQLWYRATVASSRWMHLNG